MAERPAPDPSGPAPAAEDDPKHRGTPGGAAASQSGGLVLGPARYVALTAEQEREAITALARLLALVRERTQQQPP